MDKQEFSKLAYECGYATKEEIREYTKKRTIYSERDFEKIYEISNRSKIKSTPFRTTKRYKQSWRMGNPAASPNFDDWLAKAYKISIERL